MQRSNPAGTNGFAFLEYCTPDPKKLNAQFIAMGFTPVAQHKSQDVTIFQQNDIRFFVNTTSNSRANEFATAHGPCVCAMGFRVNHAKAAYEHAIANGATPFQDENDPYQLPAICGVGGSVIYFVDYQNDMPSYATQFNFHAHTNDACPDTGLTYIDHVTHNLRRGNMAEWADFYTRIFNFYEVRYFDIEGRMTGLKSQAMSSPCGKIRIPLNESADDVSQIEEFIHDFKGEGIQHIALGTNNIYQTVAGLQQQQIAFLETPDTYYELIEKRLPNHGEPIDELKKFRILIDGETVKSKKLLLQIFTQNMLGPVFFEIIQRKGDEGFGEGNFRALFESIELDQIRRGVLSVEEETT